MNDNLTDQPALAPRYPRGLRGCRDRELLAYVGRHGIVAIPQVMAALKMGQSVAYDRVASCIEAGLLERIELLRAEPSLLRATRKGLQYVGLAMAPAIVTAGAVDHWLRCAEVARLLGERHGHHRILTERELALAERHEGRPIASAKIGELPDGRPRLHRPDLVVLPDGHPLVRFHESGSGPKRPAPDGNQVRGAREDDGAVDFSPSHSDRGSEFPGPSSARAQGGGAKRDLGSGLTAHARTRERGREIAGHDQRALAGAEDMRAYVSEDTGLRSVPGGLIAVEVELTAKSPKRLREIIRGWRRASWVAEVHYLCEPGQTRRAVERAAEKLYAQDRIVIEAVPSR
jgi:hypothetical protein